MNQALHPVQQEQFASGWIASLELVFEPRPTKTVLARRIQRGPLAVQRPFYPENEVCHVYILHPPGGVVGGDKLHISTDVVTSAQAVITTPGATKFYRSQGEQAIQNQQLNVADDASLEWLPQETIYFPGAKAKMKTQINLMPKARFIGWEIHCLGLPANQQTFSSGTIQIEFEVLCQQQPIILEKLRLDAELIQRPTGMRGLPVMATLLATPANDVALEAARAVLNQHELQLFSATLLGNCLLVRYLGDSTAQCRNVFIQVWNEIRPLVIERAACPPRIWST